MRVIMPVIIDRAGRNFNADETDGVSGRDRARKGVFTAFYEVADPVKCLLLLLLSFSSCVSMGSASRVSRGSSAFYSRSHWRARLAGA